MTNDFDEFFTRLGREVPIYRVCPDCDDLMIVNPASYEKPKTDCDPGYCQNSLPFCLCSSRVLCTHQEIENCRYPDCPESHTHDE